MKTGMPQHTQKLMVRLNHKADRLEPIFRNICSRWLLDHPIRYLGCFVDMYL